MKDKILYYYYVLLIWARNVSSARAKFKINVAGLPGQTAIELIGS